MSAQRGFSEPAVPLRGYQLDDVLRPCVRAPARAKNDLIRSASRRNIRDLTVELLIRHHPHSCHQLHHRHPDLRGSSSRVRPRAEDCVGRHCNRPPSARSSSTTSEELRPRVILDLRGSSSTVDPPILVGVDLRSSSTSS